MSYYSLISLMPKATGIDPDAQAFITAAAITNPTQQAAINQLVVDLKGYSIWSKMKAIYPFVGGTSTSTSYNLKNTAQYQIAWNGGWTWNNNGATPNGMNAWGDTKLKPSVDSSLNSNHWSFYSRTNVSQAACVEMGTRTSSSTDNDGSILIISRSLTTSYYRVNTTGTYPTFADTSSQGFMIMSRTANNIQKGYKNGVLKGTDTTLSSGLSTSNVAISAWNYDNNTFQNSFSSKEVAFASIGDGLTDTEAANFYTAVQAFQTTLNRNV